MATLARMSAVGVQVGRSAPRELTVVRKVNEIAHAQPMLITRVSRPARKTQRSAMTVALTRAKDDFLFWRSQMSPKSTLNRSEEKSDPRELRCFIVKVPLKPVSIVLFSQKQSAWLKKPLVASGDCDLSV